jgi:hypothetical protein
MQPRKPDTEVGPDSSTVAEKEVEAMVTPKPPRKRGRLQSRRARLALALGAGMMALLCLGGVGVFIALYDEATEKRAGHRHGQFPHRFHRESG